MSKLFPSFVLSAVLVCLSANASATLITHNFIFTDPDWSGSFTYDDTTGSMGPPGAGRRTDYLLTALYVETSLYSWNLADVVLSALEPTPIVGEDSLGQLIILNEYRNPDSVQLGRFSSISPNPLIFHQRGLISYDFRPGVPDVYFTEYTTALATDVPAPSVLALFALGLAALAYSRHSRTGVRKDNSAIPA